MSKSVKNKKLVIVESPAKASTIEKFLGNDYHVVSSFGHIRDLPKSKMGIDIEKGYEPQYIVARDKQKIAKQLKADAKDATEIIMASDEDREGEAIAWHVANILDLDVSKTKRIVFHEITKDAISKAIAHPRSIQPDLVNAQQARRVLDRLVGYELSPMLWRKVRRGLSAGRVQSVAVRLIVEREAEINSFSEIRSFKITANLSKEGNEFSAKLPKNIDEQTAASEFIQIVASNNLTIEEILKTPQSRKPPAPFTTSTLQQAASITLKMSVKQTMMLAQRLYEAGYISYMRTDSTNLSKSAKSEIAKYVKAEFGDNYLDASIRHAKTKGAQEAHEAIRPTSVYTETAGSDEGQKKLYGLIRKRAVASQMATAKLIKTEIIIAINSSDKQLISTGIQIEFDGFLAIDPRSSIKETILPDLEKGDKINFLSVEAEEQFKKPPKRFSEAMLVRQLEKLGIGRPSTYSPTISTIQGRGYVEKSDVEGRQVDLVKLKIDNGNDMIEEKFQAMFGSDKNRLIPTDIGKLVNSFLTDHFPNIVNFDFTAKIEKQFDSIARGELVWQSMIDDFYQPFHKLLKTVDETVSKKDTGSMKELGADPESGEIIYARFGRFGPVLQIGEANSKEDKPRFAPFPRDKKIDDVTLEDALPMLQLPRNVGNTDNGELIESSIGRFGPYIKGGSQFVSISYDDVFKIDEQKAKQLLSQGIKTKKKSEIKTFEDSNLVVKSGRFGPYVTDGKINASIPKSFNPENIKLQDAQNLLEKKASIKNKK